MKDGKTILISLTDRMGGAEQILVMLADTLNSPLFFLKKNSLHELPLKPDRKVEYVSESRLFTGFVYLIKTLYKYRKGYTIISSHGYLNAFLGFLKRIGYLQSKLIVRESTSLFSRYRGFKRFTYKFAYRMGYPAVSLVICQTELMRKELLKNNRYIPESKVITLANPINIDAVKVKGREPLLDTITEKEYICAAGRLIPIKGFDILIHAFKKIADLEKINLLILGEGPERGNLSRLIQDMELTDRVFLKGHVANPYPYFSKAKVCVVSSIQEGFPNVLLQMLVLNNRVVSTLCAGGIENIPGVIKVKAGNMEDLTKGITAALNKAYTGKRKEINEFLAERTPEQFVNLMSSKVL